MLPTRAKKASRAPQRPDTGWHGKKGPDLRRDPAFEWNRTFAFARGYSVAWFHAGLRFSRNAPIPSAVSSRIMLAAMT